MRAGRGLTFKVNPCFRIYRIRVVSNGTKDVRATSDSAFTKVEGTQWGVAALLIKGSTKCQ